MFEKKKALMAVAALGCFAIAGCSGSPAGSSSSENASQASSQSSAPVVSSSQASSESSSEQNTTPSLLITASMEDGLNTVGNVNDDNLDSYWAANGEGQWLQFQVTPAKPLGGISIAWHKGNERKAYYEVLASDNGQDWHTVVARTESTGGLNPTDVTFHTQIDMPFIRVVGYGNSGGSSWNSITEASLLFCDDYACAPKCDDYPACISDNAPVTSSSAVSTSSSSSSVASSTAPINPNAVYPVEVVPDIARWKITLPVDSNGNDSSGGSSKDDINHNAAEIKDEGLEMLLREPHFFVENGEMVFNAHCAGATTSGSSYPRSELRQRVGGGDNYWSVNDLQYISVDLRVTETPVYKPEISVVQIHGPEDEPLRVQYSANSPGGIWYIWNETNKVYLDPSKDNFEYALGQRLRVDVTVEGGRIYLYLKNLDNGQTYANDWESNDSTGYFKVGAYTQSSIYLQSIKGGDAQDEPADAAGEVRVSRIQLFETYEGETTGVRPGESDNTETPSQETGADIPSIITDGALFDLEGGEQDLSPLINNKTLQFLPLVAQHTTSGGNGLRHEYKIKSSEREDFFATYEKFKATVKVEMSNGGKTIISQIHGGVDVTTLLKVFVADTNESGFEDSQANNGIFDVYARIQVSSSEDKMALGIIRSGESFDLEVINNHGLVTITAFGKTFERNSVNDGLAYFKFGNYLQSQNPNGSVKCGTPGDTQSMLDCYAQFGISNAVVTMTDVSYERM